MIAKLGQGGMGLVHLALAQSVAGVRKLVVLKSVRPEFVADPKVGEMFFAEARLAVALNHPNIVQTFEVIERRGAPVLVMEYLEGQPLSRLINQSDHPPPPLALRLFVIREVLSGLAYLHDLCSLDGKPLNPVHRDISPHNIFVTYDGQVKILDFGIAKAMGSTGLTDVGQIKGKVRYMSPEQMIGSPRVDRRADVFSVGVLLWEMLTERRLWDGLSDVQVMQQVLSEEVPAPSDAAEVDPRLEAICRKALAHDSRRRYESAAAMRADLDDAIDELGLQSTHRAAGAFIAAAFDELRATTRRIIETQLRDESAPPVQLTPLSGSEAVTAKGAAISGDPWQSPTGVSMSTPALKPVRRRPNPFVALAAVGLLLALATIFSVRHVRVHAAVDPARTTAAAPAPPLRLDLEPSTPAPAPADALGSALVGAPPTAAVPVVPPASAVPVAPVLPVAEAAPPAPRAPVAPVAAVKAVPVVKAAAVRSSSPARPARKGHGSSGTAGAGHTRVSRSCDPPFYYDDDRIKRMKPDCFN